MKLDSGLLFVLARTRPEDAELFDDWYDTDHVPARVPVPGFRTARRYVEDGDGILWPYVAAYELTGLDILSSPAYLALGKHEPSLQELAAKRFAEFDRYVYRLLPTPAIAQADETGLCGSYLLCEWGSVGSGGSEWFSDERLSRTMELPGWKRARRYVLEEGNGATHMIAYDIDSFDEAAYRETLATVPKIDSPSETRMRLFRLHRRFDGAKSE